MAVFLSVAIVGIGVGYYFVLYPNTTVKDDGIIFIRPNDSFETVCLILQDKGYIKNEYTFCKVAEVKKYPSLVKAGRFRIKDGINNNDLINMLRSGKQTAVKFTFNNIRTLEQFSGIISEQLSIDSSAFLNKARDTEFLEEIGFIPASFIGMFIPNTYQIYWDISVDRFILKMADEYKKFWNDERLEKAERAGLSSMDVMILASIIEEETIKPEEYPIIAGVYINRLNKGMLLNACPTLKFAWGDFTLKRILDKHTGIESPYNTYKYKGLPPGPVRMASIPVIDAVLNYQHHDYLYFCAKNDFSGSHFFSKTLREHNQHANEYHQELNKRKIY